MRRALSMLTIALWLTLAGVVVTAVPAAAHPGVGACAPGERRNLGGTEPACSSCPLPPGFGERRNLGGTELACSSCWLPRGFGERRNLGGTGLAGCPPGLGVWWHFPRLRTG